MAHEITNSDGMVLAGKPAWHGLGTVVADAPTLTGRTLLGADGVPVNEPGALQIAGLDWSVEPRDLAYFEPAGDASWTSFRGHKALVRSDTGAVLGLASASYRPLQNRELAETLEALVPAAEQELGRRVKVETAGSIRGGRDVFFLLRTGSFLADGATDRVEEYLIGHTAHDGSSAVRVYPTDVRVVCANTIAVAGRDAGKGLAFRHVGDISGRIRAALPVLKAALEAGGRLREQLLTLGRRELTRDEHEGLVRAVHFEVYGDDREKETTARNKAVYRRAAWIAAGLPGASGQLRGGPVTAWSALNGITYAAREALTTRRWPAFEWSEIGLTNETLNRVKAVSLRHALALTGAA